MLIRDVMTRDCKFCDEGESLGTIATMMAEQDIGAVPVGRGDKLAGMVTDRDIVVRGLARTSDPLKLTAGDVMAAPVHYCFDDEECEAVADQMATSQVRRMPVVDRDKRLVGFVSLSDLARGGARKAALVAEEGVAQPAA